MSTYLYVKTHNKTGLKYLGKTIQNPYKYKGSGVYWCRHLSKHGNDVTTEILKECQNDDEVKYWGQYYSDLWNVVDDNAWANLKPETGEGGSGIMTASTKEKIKQYKHQYHIINKEKANIQSREYSKIYRENNKEKLKDERKMMITCECGCLVRKCAKSRHDKSLKHRSLVDVQSY